MQAGFMCLFFVVLLLTNTYELPLHFIAKVKVKEEIKICIK